MSICSLDVGSLKTEGSKKFLEKLDIFLIKLGFTKTSPVFGFRVIEHEKFFCDTEEVFAVFDPELATWTLLEETVQLMEEMKKLLSENATIAHQEYMVGVIVSGVNRNIQSRLGNFCHFLEQVKKI
jgi:hypothetical protein